MSSYAMPSRSILPRRASIRIAAGLALAATSLCGTQLASQVALAIDIPAVATPPAAYPPGSSRDLYLEVFLNGTPTELVAAVKEGSDASLSMDPEQLRNVGVLPQDGARQPDGLIDLARLEGVSFVYDDVAQTLTFSATDAALAPKLLLAGPTPSSTAANVEADYGALLNYSLHLGAAYPLEDGEGLVLGLSGNLEARFFGPLGVLQTTYSVRGGEAMEHRRLDTTWSYSDPGAMRTFRAGDIVTGGLSWTRPARLGGIQMQNDFSLRPDLVTIPVPGLSGTAAVPSTIEVYLNNARRFTAEVPPGPFEIGNLPAVTGPGKTKLVVRDAEGREIVTESDYFASNELLRPGFLDYSLELGFPRQDFGMTGDHYDPRLMASASIRYGATDWLTFEGHGEGGEAMLNLGLGATLQLGTFGIGSLAVASSTTGADHGFQVSGAAEFELGSVHFAARALRTFGQYDDIASVTFDPPAESTLPHRAGGVPRSLDQLAVSLALPFEGSRLGLSYTQLESAVGEHQRLVGLSYGQPLFGGAMSASAFADLEHGRYGVFASFSMPIGDDISSSSSAVATSAGASVFSELSQSVDEDGSGWRLRYGQGAHASLAAEVSGGASQFEGTARVAYGGDRVFTSLDFDGAIVAAGGGVFLSDTIEDAFAVVDVGAPGVTVLFENREVGETGKDGKLLLPSLRAYEKNRVAIDPAELPLDTAIQSTRKFVVPADRSGVVVSFAGSTTGGAAIVSFRDEANAFLEVGTSGRAGADGPEFIVGYDGQAYVEGLGPHNVLVLENPQGDLCEAVFDYASESGMQVVIKDVECRST